MNQMNHSIATISKTEIYPSKKSLNTARNTLKAPSFALRKRSSNWKLKAKHTLQKSQKQKQNRTPIMLRDFSYMFLFPIWQDLQSSLCVSEISLLLLFVLREWSKFSYYNCFGVLVFCAPFVWLYIEAAPF